MFDFLNAVRETGAMNMMGAAPTLVENFDVDRREAREVLQMWMQVYSEDGYDHLVGYTVDAALKRRHELG